MGIVLLLSCVYSSICAFCLINTFLRATWSNDANYTSLFLTHYLIFWAVTQAIWSRSTRFDGYPILSVPELPTILDVKQPSLWLNVQVELLFLKLNQNLLLLVLPSKANFLFHVCSTIFSTKNMVWTWGTTYFPSKRMYLWIISRHLNWASSKIYLEEFIAKQSLCLGFLINP